MFEELIALEPPKPMTKKEFEKEFIKKLQDVGFSKLNAKELSKDIFKHHFPED